jgi:rubrerythrin
MIPNNHHPAAKGGQRMPFENLKAIVDFAIQREKEAAAFYEAASAESAMSGAREMLQEFAGEERKHQRLLESIDAKGITPSLEAYKLKWIADIKRSDYVTDLTYRPGMAYNEILMVAMKREEKALKLYNDLLGHAETPEQRKLFKVLCQEEAKHKLAFETLYDDYMAKMGD